MEVGVVEGNRAVRGVLRVLGVSLGSPISSCSRRPSWLYTGCFFSGEGSPRKREPPWIVSRRRRRPPSTVSRCRGWAGQALHGKKEQDLERRESLGSPHPQAEQQTTPCPGKALACRLRDPAPSSPYRWHKRDSWRHLVPPQRPRQGRSYRRIPLPPPPRAQRKCGRDLWRPEPPVRPPLLPPPGLPASHRDPRDVLLALVRHLLSRRPILPGKGRRRVATGRPRRAGRGGLWVRGAPGRAGQRRRRLARRRSRGCACVRATPAGGLFWQARRAGARTRERLGGSPCPGRPAASLSSCLISIPASCGSQRQTGPQTGRQLCRGWASSSPCPTKARVALGSPTKDTWPGLSRCKAGSPGGWAPHHDRRGLAPSSWGCLTESGEALGPFRVLGSDPNFGLRTLDFFH